MKIEICGQATFEADTIEEVKDLIRLHDEFTASHPIAGNAGNRAQSARQSIGAANVGTRNTDAWVAAHPDKQRFRITMEERAIYGDNRELIAMERLKTEGLPYEEAQGSKAGMNGEDLPDTDEDSFV